MKKLTLACFAVLATAAFAHGQLLITVSATSANTYQIALTNQSGVDQDISFGNDIINVTVGADPFNPDPVFNSFSVTQNPASMLWSSNASLTNDSTISLRVDDPSLSAGGLGTWANGDSLVITVQTTQTISSFNILALFEIAEFNLDPDGDPFVTIPVGGNYSIGGGGGGSPIPEPSTYAAILGSLFLAVFIVRRRRNR